MRRPIALLERCGREFGEVFRLKLSKLGWVFIWHPDDVRALYAARDQVVAGAAKVRLFGELIGTTSVLVLDGDAHLQRRRLLLPHFRGPWLRKLTEPIINLTEQMMVSWPRDTPFTLYPTLHQLTLDVILLAIFGSANPGESSDLRTTLRRYATEAVSSKLVVVPALRWNLGPRSPWGRVLELVASADEVIRAEIRRRQRENIRGDDLMTTLLSCGENPEDGMDSLSEDQLRDELLTMIVTGHETTAIGLAWTLLALCLRPEVQQKIRDEGNRVTGSQPLQGKHVSELVYLDSFIRECLRFYSAVPNGSFRVATKPYRLRDWVLPPGTGITVALHLLHRRPDLYENPDELIPERFIGRRINPYEWAPFGGGTRKCIGQLLALHEITVVLATILRSVSVAPPRGRPRDYGEPRRTGAFVAPAHHLPVQLSAL